MTALRWLAACWQDWLTTAHDNEHRRRYRALLAIAYLPLTIRLATANQPEETP